jgi:hypothetical protein
MKRNLAVFTLTLAAAFGGASAAQAQVFIRAPFVRVGVGPGVYVRAPFVNLWVPPAPVFLGPRVYVAPPVYAAPPPVYVAPAPRVVESPPPAPVDPQPAPQPAPNGTNNAPPPAKAVKALSLEEFAKTFQPKGGNYEVNLVSPINNQITLVRFTLPEGNPRRVHLRPNEIEFDYGIRRFVRIEFDNEGAIVTSR